MSNAKAVRKSVLHSVAARVSRKMLFLEFMVTSVEIDSVSKLPVFVPKWGAWSAHPKN